ncbi:MAG: CPBP family intramembrane glutamic endopeptidase [Pseudomonadota bacterium]
MTITAPMPMQRLPLLLPILLITSTILLFRAEKLLPVDSPFAGDMIHSSLQILLGFAVLWLLKSFGLFKQTGLTKPVRQWPRRWPLAVIPMAMIGLINLLSVEWGQLQFDAVRFGGWIYNSLSTGFFEEILLRGFCFYYLYQCWRERKNALLMAAIAQALIFGLAHLSNLQSVPAADVIPQVIYATLLGIGFAGIAAYTGSIWPVMAVHAFINAMGDMNNFFGPDLPDEPGSLAGYTAAIVIIACASTLPGLYLLRLARLKSAAA